MVTSYHLPGVQPDHPGDGGRDDDHDGESTSGSDDDGDDNDDVMPAA